MPSAVDVASSYRLLRAPAVAAIAGRDFRITRSYRLAFALDVFYGGLDLAFYFFVAKLVGPVSGASLAGAPTYFGFAAVGLAIGAVLSATMYALSAEVRQEQLTGTLEVLAAQPVPSVELGVGLLAFPLAFSFVRSGVYLAVASHWMHIDVTRTSWAGVAVVFAATAVAMAPISFAAGAAVLVFKRGTVVVTAATSVMTLLGGAVFPIAVLPGWLQWLGRLMPIRFAYDGVRAAIFSGSGWGLDALALLAFGAVGAPLGMFLFGRALAHAKRVGSLSEY